MIVLLIGPSGVGKSSCGQFASQQIPNCEFYDLDDLVRQLTGREAIRVLNDLGNDGFLEVCQKCLADLETRGPVEGTLLLIAVGAGALQSHLAAEWLARYTTTIFISAPAAEVYKRNPLGPNRDFREFYQTEYSVRRQTIYEAATYKLAVDGLTEDNARRRFIELVTNKVSTEPSK